GQLRSHLPLVVVEQPGARSRLGRRAFRLGRSGRLALCRLLAFLLFLLRLGRRRGLRGGDVGDLRLLTLGRRPGVNSGLLGRRFTPGHGPGVSRATLLGFLFLGIRHDYFAFTRGIGWPDFTATRSAVPSLSRRRRTRVGSPDFGSSSITFDAAIGAVSSMMPLSSFGVAARLCFFTMFTPSTTTRNSLGCTRSTLPSFPRCSPEITRTVSPLAICSLWRSGSRGPASRRLFLKTSGFMSDHLRRERYDLHEPFLAQLAPHGSEDTGRAGLALIRDEHGGVLVEPDVGAVPALGLLGRPHDHRLY